jgi:hypothetical protein
MEQHFELPLELSSAGKRNPAIALRSQLRQAIADGRLGLGPGAKQLATRSRSKPAALRILLYGLACIAVTLPLGAAGELASATKPAARDGQHDFDFNLGEWHTHIKRISDPLAGASGAIELDGTVTVRKVWDGRAFLEEIEADGPKGHWEGLSLFLYNPQSHQWSQSFVSSRLGVLTQPLIGEFRDGRGELYGQDTFNDRSILVRGVWSDIKPNSHRYEESYSADGGKTWWPAFIANLTRIR